MGNWALDQLRRGAFCCLGFVILACATVPVPAQEWTRFRGPNGAGQSEAKIPAKWSDADINWKVELTGSGHSSPVLWGDKIFVTSADTKSSKRYLICLSTSDGHELWRKGFDYQNYHINPLNSFSTSTPAVDAEHVYAAWGSPEQSALYAFSHSGDEVWHCDLGGFISQHGFAASPIVYDDLVILGNEQDGPDPEKGGDPNLGYDGKSFIWAIDRTSGKVRWKIPRKSTIVTYAVPCVYQPKDGKPELIFDSRSHGMCAIDPATGHIDWELPIFSRRPVGSPIIVAGLLLGACGVGSGENTLYAIRPDGESHNPQVVYKIEKSPAPYVPTPVAAGNLVFLFADRGVVSCIDGATGKTKWRRDHLATTFSGSPVRAADKIFCASADGDMLVLAASDEYQLLAQNPLGELCRSTPAIAGGRMYVRTVSHLISVGGK
jgi:outer membrane protein assembly factor BamB